MSDRRYTKDPCACGDAFCAGCDETDAPRERCGCGELRDDFGACWRCDRPDSAVGGPRFPGVVVQLTGGDGNVFAVIGAVQRALRKAGHEDEAKRFADDAFACKSYDAVLVLAMATVVVR